MIKKINSMRLELLMLDTMEYISQDTKEKAKTEILQKIRKAQEILEKGQKYEIRNFQNR